MEQYGAYVDLGNGMIGLIHISQISSAHVSAAGMVFEKGDRVKVGLCFLCLHVQAFGYFSTLHAARVWEDITASMRIA